MTTESIIPHFLPLQEILILLVSLFGALTVASLSARLRVKVGPAPARALADYVGTGEAVDPVEWLGKWLLQRLPGLRTAARAMWKDIGAGWTGVT
jgi:hypothetical protein